MAISCENKAYRHKWRLPRRFAPRNDGGGFELILLFFLCIYWKMAGGSMTLPYGKSQPIGLALLIFSSAFPSGL